MKEKKSSSKKSNKQKATADFERKFFGGVLKKNPNHVEALMIAAEIYTRDGFYKEGLKLDYRLSKICKTDPTVFYNLACSYALTKQREKALKALKKAIALGYDDFDHLLKDDDLLSVRDEVARWSLRNMK